MKRKMSQRVICLLLALTTLLGAFGITVGAANGELKPNGTASTLEEMKSLVGVSTYAEYLEDWSKVATSKPKNTISVNILDNERQRHYRWQKPHLYSGNGFRPRCMG